MGHGPTTVPRRYLVAALLTLVLLSGAALLAAKPAGAQTDRSRTRARTCSSPSSSTS